MSKRTFFVTSSGTEIGKTYVTTGLIRSLREADQPVDALKPLITDFTDDTRSGSDTVLILDALGQDAADQNIERVSPWRYRAALAPDMAAALEGLTVPYDDVTAYCNKVRAELGGETTLIVEGAGGVLVPVDDSHTMRDFMIDLAATPILVVGSYLGTISHTLTALEALNHKGLAPVAIVVSETEDAGIPLDDTCHAIQRFTGDVPLIAVPRGDQTAFAALARLVAA